MWPGTWNEFDLKTPNDAVCCGILETCNSFMMILGFYLFIYPPHPRLYCNCMSNLLSLHLISQATTSERYLPLPASGARSSFTDRCLSGGNVCTLNHWGNHSQCNECTIHQLSVPLLLIRLDAWRQWYGGSRTVFNSGDARSIHRMFTRVGVDKQNRTRKGKQGWNIHNLVAWILWSRN